MAGYDNIKEYGFDKRTAEERREIAIKAGKASGVARRKKANFRKTLNALLTAEIEHPDWTPFLEALGMDSTLEAAVNAAMIREALNGNVKAYEALAKYSGQSVHTEKDEQEQETRMKYMQAQTDKATRDTAPEEDGVVIIDDL